MFEAEQITIVGVGLLGGSLGLALRQRGFRGRILGVGRREESLACALEKGCIDQGFTDLAPGVGGSEVVVLATPVGKIREYLQELSDCAATGAVITDVGSTKARICATALDVLRNAERFVGSHPMAGSEKHGPGHACGDLFVGKPCVVTPMCDAGTGWQTDGQAVARVEAMWNMVGMRVVQMSPGDHDAAVARVSHLPHALAVMMVHAANREGGLEVASTGFRDTTRIASGDPQVWADIFLSNPQAVGQAMEAMCSDMKKMRDVIQAGDRATLVKLLQEGKQLRDRWMERQWGAGEV